MTRSRLLPILALLVACGGGGGGEPSTPPLVIAKGTPSGDAQSGVVWSTLAQPLRVVITQDGAPVTGQSVTFMPGGGAGTVAPSPVLTDVNGVASATWTLGQASGSKSVTVTSPGATGGPILFGATALPGPASQAIASGGSGQIQEAGASFPGLLTVRVQDGFGNGISGVSVAWTVVSGSGTVSAPTTNTAANGNATVAAIAGGTPGPLSVIGVSSALPADTLHFDLSVTPVATVVTIGNNFFSPDTIVIPVGGAVRWNWNGGPHNVTYDAGPTTFPNSATQGAGATYGPLVFDVAGTYTYVCTVHPNMVATIKVQ